MTNLQSLSSTSARGLWVAVVTGVSTVISLVLACATPYSALAALAAERRRMTDAMLLVLAGWGAAQAVNFATRGFSMDGEGAIWSATLLAAAIMSAMIALRVTEALSAKGAVLRISASYLTAFAGFKAVVLVTTLLLDSGHGAFAADVLARQFVRNGLILASLLVLQLGLNRIGLGLPAGRPAQA